MKKNKFLLITIVHFFFNNQIIGQISTDCDTLNYILKVNEISFYEYEDFFVRISEMTNLKGHWKLSENGLVYDNKKKMISDVKKWKRRLKCN